MARRDAMVAAVAAVEYLKEAARQTASRLVADANAADVVANPEMFVDQVIAAMDAVLGELTQRMLDETQSYAAELGFNVPAEADFGTLAQAERSDWLAQLRPALLAAIAPLQADLLAHMAKGVSSETLATAMTDGALSGVLLRNFTATLRGESADMLNRVHLDVLEVLAVASTAAQPELELTWITMRVGVCDDGTEEGSCAPRHGLTRTIEQWAPLGHPWVPNRLCEDRCRCTYVTDGGAAIRSPIDLKQAIAAAKAEAVADYGPESA